MALGGIDPVTFFQSSGPRPGGPGIHAKFRESTFLFSSEDNKKIFLENPEKFSPQFNGFCAFGTAANGYKAKTEPIAYTLVGGKLFLNYDLGVQKKWLRNRDDFIQKASVNWPSVMKTTKVYQ